MIKFYMGIPLPVLLDKQPLAQEDIQKQLNNRLEVRKTPIMDTQDQNKDKNPFPWLDKEDP